MLQAGHQVPHFRVSAIDGTGLEYKSLWQRQHLLLVCLPAADDAESRSYIEAVRQAACLFAPDDVACVFTRDAIDGISRPGVVIADRWGEIVFVAHAAEVSMLPSPRELSDWVRYVQSKCPECEGEAL